MDNYWCKDSHPIKKRLTKNERRLYLKKIKKDITYFRRTYKRADITVDISVLDPVQAAAKIKEAVKSL